MKPKTLQQLKALQQRGQSGGYAEDDPRSNESIAGRMMKRDPGGWALNQSRMQRLRSAGQIASDDRIARLQQMWHDMQLEHPQLTGGVGAHFLPSTQAAWHKQPGETIPAGASSPTDVYFNVDQMANMDDQTAQFVLAKELGVPAARRLIDGPAKAKRYLEGLGSGATTVRGWPYWGQVQIDRAGASAPTTPGEWYGRDFAQSLGYIPNDGTANIRLDPNVEADLQARGVLPRSASMQQLRKIRSRGRR